MSISVTTPLSLSVSGKREVSRLSKSITRLPDFSNVVEYDATSGQVESITKLCRALGIKSPLEEKKMTFGEAGRLVRKLSIQLKREKGKPRRR